MRIKELEIGAFRNLQKTDLQASAQLNSFVGQNGQGKTNLLEAIYFCLRGKSFRPYSSRKDVVGKNLSMTYPQVRILLENDRGYSFNVDKRWISPTRVQYLLDGKKVTARKISELAAIVVFSPDDHSLVRGAAESRRDFLDDLFCDIAPGYIDTLERFNKSLRSRNRVLSDLKKQARFEVTAELKTWTKTLSEVTHDLSTMRYELWPVFDKAFSGICGQLLDKNLPNVTLVYESNVDKSWKTSQVYEYLLEDFQKDIATGWTHRGVQRDDIKISIDEELLARHHASQSQARLLALALKWTHAELLENLRDERSIFLLDDFSSELDESHRKALLEQLRISRGQLFISGTEMDLIPKDLFETFSAWEISKGKTQKL